MDRKQSKEKLALMLDNILDRKKALQKPFTIIVGSITDEMLKKTYQICVEIKFNKIENILDTPLHLFGLDTIDKQVLQKVKQFGYSYTLQDIVAFDRGVFLFFDCDNINELNSNDIKTIESNILARVTQLIEKDRKLQAKNDVDFSCEVKMIEFRFATKKQHLCGLIKYKFSQTNDYQAQNLADLVYIVKGIDEGRNAWYYVLVNPSTLQKFHRDRNKDIMHLEDCGTILYSAFGDEPSKEVTDMLKKEYGIE